MIMIPSLSGVLLRKTPRYAIVMGSGGESSASLCMIGWRIWNDVHVPCVPTAHGQDAHLVRPLL